MSTLLVAIGLGVVVVGAAASPAAAHGGPGGSDAPASNYRSRVLEVAPVIDGLDVRVVEAGSRLELVNRTGDDVVVLGYQDEPYLRVGPDGVYENTRSPAVDINQDRSGQNDGADDADPEAEPEWRRVAEGPSARWHDHRIHRMGGDDPAAVATDPNARHVIEESWEVPLRVGDRSVTVTGDLTWIPGSSPWGWYAAAAVVSVLLILASRGPQWRLAVAAAVLLLLAASAVDTIGVWGATAEPASAKSSVLLMPALFAVAAVVGVVMVWRKAEDGFLLVGVAGAAFLLMFGLVNLDWLSRSQLPTSLATFPARATVTVSLGAGAAALALSGLGLFRPSAHMGSSSGYPPRPTWRTHRRRRAGALRSSSSSLWRRVRR